MLFFFFFALRSIAHVRRSYLLTRTGRMCAKSIFQSLLLSAVTPIYDDPLWLLGTHFPEVRRQQSHWVREGMRVSRLSFLLTERTTSYPRIMSRHKGEVASRLWWRGGLEAVEPRFPLRSRSSYVVVRHRAQALSYETTVAAEDGAHFGVLRKPVRSGRQNLRRSCVFH